eukprot:scaffold3.g6349.t1
MPSPEPVASGDSEARIGHTDSGEHWARHLAAVRALPPAQRHLEADALLRCEQLQEQAAQAISRWREWAEDGVCDESVKALATFLAAVAAAPAAHEAFGTHFRGHINPSLTPPPDVLLKFVGLACSASFMCKIHPYDKQTVVHYCITCACGMFLGRLHSRAAVAARLAQLGSPLTVDDLEHFVHELKLFYIGYMFGLPEERLHDALQRVAVTSVFEYMLGRLRPGAELDAMGACRRACRVWLPSSFRSQLKELRESVPITDSQLERAERLQLATLPYVPLPPPVGRLLAEGLPINLAPVHPPDCPCCRLQQQRQCAGCGNVVPQLKWCSACRNVGYCSVACQKRHWREGHKEECTRLAAQRRWSSSWAGGSSTSCCKSYVLSAIEFRLSSTKVIRAVDADGSGSIDTKELQQALALGGLSLSLRICNQLIRTVDRDFSGTSMRCIQACAACCPKLQNLCTVSISEFKDLHGFLTEAHAAFAAAAGSEGQVAYMSREALDRLLAAENHALEPPALAMLFSVFDPNRDGKIDLGDYVALKVFLRSARLIFDAFDPARSGKISVDYSQFVYAAANTR